MSTSVTSGIPQHKKLVIEVLLHGGHEGDIGDNGVVSRSGKPRQHSITKRWIVEVISKLGGHVVC